MKSRGIDFDYTAKYTTDGFLISIDFNVDCNDGFSGKAEANPIWKRGKFGFYRDYQKDSVSPFGVGRFK